MHEECHDHEELNGGQCEQAGVNPHLLKICGEYPVLTQRDNAEDDANYDVEEDSGMIAAGPVHVSVKGNPTFVFIRLIEAYENVLRAAGVSTYYFFTNGRLLKALDRIGGIAGAEEVSVDDDRTWFRKVI